MTIGGTMTVWAGSIERGNLRLAPGDIQEAITWFQEKIGQEPKLTTLNQKNERFADEAGDGIRVVTPRSIKA